MFRNDPVCSLPASARFGWTTSSSLLILLLLLLKGEFTLHVLLSENSLNLPLSESESFTFSLILSVLIKIFCEVFSKLKFGPRFSMLLVAR